MTNGFFNDQTRPDSSSLVQPAIPPLENCLFFSVGLHCFNGFGVVRQYLESIFFSLSLDWDASSADKLVGTLSQLVATFL